MGMQIWKRRAYCCMSSGRARLWSCIRRFVAASLRSGRAVLSGYSVLGGLITFEIWTHLSLYFCVGSVQDLDTPHVVFLRGTCSGLEPSESGLSNDSSPKKRCILARHLLITHTVQVLLHVSRNISGVSIAQVSKMQTNPGIDFSGASYGEFASFHWLSFPPSLKPQRPKRWQYRREPQWAMRGMRLRNVGCAAKGTMPRPGPLVDGRRAGDVERGDRGKVFGVVLLAVEASQFGFQVHWSWTFLFPLYTQLRYEKNMRIVGLTGHSICLIL